MIQNPSCMSILLKKIAPSSSGTSAIDAMILGSTFTSCSVAYCFVIYLVASFAEVIYNQFSISLNDKSSIVLNFWFLWDIYAKRGIFNYGSGFYLKSSHDMTLHWFFADFSLASF